MLQAKHRCDVFWVLDGRWMRVILEPVEAKRRSILQHADVPTSVFISSLLSGHLTAAFFAREHQQEHVLPPFFRPK
jgi:hypothetical protein